MVRLTGIEYVFNNEGETISIDVKFQGFNNRENITSTVSIIGDDLDNFSRTDIEQKGRARMKELVTGEKVE